MRGRVAYPSKSLSFLRETLRFLRERGWERESRARGGGVDVGGGQVAKPVGTFTKKALLPLCLAPVKKPVTKPSLGFPRGRAETRAGGRGETRVGGRVGGRLRVCPGPLAKALFA